MYRLFCEKNVYMLIWKKCMEMIVFIWYIVSVKGIEMDVKKVKAI
jgi:hypothetical protein